MSTVVAGETFAVEFQAKAQKTAAKVSPEQAGLRKALKAKITKKLSQPIKNQ